MGFWEEGEKECRKKEEEGRNSYLFFFSGTHATAIAVTNRGRGSSTCTPGYSGKKPRSRLTNRGRGYSPDCSFEPSTYMLF